MERERAPETHRFCLPSGTVVEDWRVVGCHGHGAYGIVYRAVRIGQESSGPVALKMALYPWDPRFMREVALSMAPEVRGTAGELAEALEAAAGCAGLVEEPPPPPRESAVVSVPPRIPEELCAPEKGRTQAHLRGWKPWHVVAIASAVLLVWAWRVVHVRPDGGSAKEQVALAEARPDAGTTGLGAAVPKTPSASAHAPARQKSIAQDTPPEPFPGQLRSDAKGRCPGEEQVPINGGCWVEHRSKDTRACEQNGYVLFKGRCYAPALAPRRKPQPTSDPTDPQ